MPVWLRLLLGLWIAIGLSGPARAGTDLATVPASDIEALQKRLGDDGCYAGPVDGQASAETIAAVERCPDQQPVLRIETGMHVGAIRRIGTDAACALLVTGSDDKTIRLWSLPDGHLKRTIRLPISPGDGGKIYAAALSPDGRTLAAGGWDATSDSVSDVGLYVVGLDTGRLRRLGHYDDVINQIAFSPDGTRLAAGLGSGGLRILDRDSGRELMADRDYGGPVYGIVFGPEGSLFTTSWDGMLRRYGPDLMLKAKVAARDGKRPYDIAIDAGGHRAAVGYEDTSGVSILDAATLRPLTAADTRDVSRAMRAVAWTPDGQQLVAGGSANAEFDGDVRRFLRRFSAGGKRIGRDVPAAANSIFDLRSCASGIVFATADPSFGTIDAKGQLRELQRSVTADMRGKSRGAFLASADGDRVRFGLGYGGQQPVLFDLAAGTLVDAPAEPAGFNAARIEGLPIENWKNSLNPTFAGRPIALSPYELTHSLAVRSDGAGFALGAEFSLRAYEADGRQRWRAPAPGTAWGVDLTRGGDLVVAAYDDGTIRWHRWSDGQELLALFVDVADRRWVAWTPSGYYLASPGAEDLIGWHVNRGWEQEADFFPASRFRDRFNRPDIVRAVLQTLDEAEAIQQANGAAKRRADPKPLIERLPPVITIVSPNDGSTVAPGAVEIRYTLRSPSGGSVDRVEAFVDGAKIEARGIGPAAHGTPDPAGGGVVVVPMPAHDSEISLVAYADGKAGDAARIGLRALPPTAGATAGVDAAEAFKPSLYALLIGVTHYDNSAYDLAYPAQDALALAEALKGQDGKLYRHVEVKVLTDKEATALAVKTALIWLQRKTTARDLAVVFAAGHGMTDAKGRFWFLTADADPDALSISAVSKDDIADVLYDLPGKKLLFLDACHSGAALDSGARGVQSDLSAAINDFAQTEGGVVVYAASTGREVSFESPQWGHGAFTKALIEGFGGQADLMHRGLVTTGSLDVFIEDRVKALTDGRQHPVMTRPKTVPDFPIAAVP